MNKWWIYLTFLLSIPIIGCTGMNPPVEMQKEKSHVERQEEKRSLLIKEMPEKMGLLVETRSRDDRQRVLQMVVGNATDRTPAVIFFKTRDKDFIAEQMVDADVYIRPALIGELPKSNFVEWAVQATATGLAPEYRLLLDVHHVGVGSKGGIPPVYGPTIYGTIELQHMESETVLFKKHLSNLIGESDSMDSPIRFQSNPRIRFLSKKYDHKNSRTLDGFYKEVAEQARYMLDDFFSKR